MSDDLPRRSPRRLLAHLQRALESAETDPEARELGRAILTRAERAMGHLEGASQTLETAARLQLSILRRMVPIVEDLGELVRHSLEDARERRGGVERQSKGQQVVIEVEGKSD